MLAFYILALMMIFGWIASKLGVRSAYSYALAAGIGAVVGAFAAFGDMPIPIQQTRLPLPFVTGLIGALVFAGVLWLWRRNK